MLHIIHRLLSPKCQMMFFSATYEQRVMEFAEYIVQNPIVIRLRRDQESLDNIKQYYVQCKNQDEKYQAIQNIYGVITVGQAIIFCHVNRLSLYIYIGKSFFLSSSLYILYISIH